MDQPPRDARAPLFTRAFAWRLAWQGALVGALTLGAYFLGGLILPGGGPGLANTMAFSTLTFCQLFHAFDVRSERASLLRIGPLSNPAMDRAFLAGLVMQLAVLCVPPLRAVFGTVAMPPAAWACVLALAAAPVAVCELAKAAARRRGRPRRPEPGVKVPAGKT